MLWAYSRPCTWQKVAFLWFIFFFNFCKSWGNWTSVKFLIFSHWQIVGLQWQARDDVNSLSPFVLLYLMKHSRLKGSFIWCCKMKCQAQDNSASLWVTETLSSVHVSSVKGYGLSNFPLRNYQFSKTVFWWCVLLSILKVMIFQVEQVNIPLEKSIL